MPFASTVATALAALVTGPAAALILSTPAEAASATASSSAITVPAQGEKHWSAAEMRSASPAESAAVPGHPSTAPSATPSQGPSGSFEVTGEQSRPLTTHGRLFYTKRDDPQGRAFSCSGTVVRSAGANVIFTAGHCLADPESREFHENVTFVPAYRAGEDPFGQFPARDLSAPAGWVFDGNTSYDIGAIALEDRAQDVVGGRRVAFDQPIRRIGRLTLFGYPAEPSHLYDGERPIGCDSALRRTFNLGGPPSLVAAPCDMRQGSSGGGWVTPAGFLVSVVSHGYCDAEQRACNFLLGPYFGDAAKRLYREAGTTERIRLGFHRDPGRVTGSRRPGFRIAVDASTPVRLECKLNRRPTRRCRAAFRLPRLEPGRYVLRVRATDQIGRRALIGHAFRVIGS